jgi:Cdc6-like AAA superfamily ATPase
MPDCWDYDAFEIIIKRTFKAKDLRIGLFLMKMAGDSTEKRGSEKVETKDVEEALKKLDTSKDIGSFV